MATSHFSSNAVDTGASSATTVADTLPASLTNGDVLVCVVSAERATAIPGTPTGLANTWTVINAASNTDGSWFLGFVTLTAADSSVTFTSTVSAARRMALGWSIVRGGDSTAVTSALGTYTANGTGVLTATAPSITPASNDSMLVSVWANTDSVTPFSRTQTIAGTGFTQRFFDQSTAAASNNALVGGGTRQIAAGGGSSQTGGTLTDSSTKFNWIAATVAVPPLPLGASPNAQPMNVGVAMVFDPSGGSIGLELSLVGALAVGTTMTGSTTSGAGAVGPTPGPVGDGPVFCRIDWAQDGNFNSVGDDVTARIRGAITAQYGRDQDTSLQQIVAGRGSIVLDNRSRDYSPRNVDSPLYPLVKPNRPTLIERKVGATLYTLFRAHTDDSPINPDLDSKTVAVGLVDYLADLKGQTIATPLYQGIRTGAAVGYVLDAIGWTGGRDLDVGASILPWWWEDGTDALEALQKIVASEGQPAFLSIGPVGEFVFRDRHHRLTRAASTTSQSTWRGSGPVEPVMGVGFTYDEAWANTVNDVTFTVTERTPDPRQSWVWTTDETLNLAAFESRVVVISTSDPFYQGRAPIVNSDYFVQSGSITSTSISRTSGASTSVTLTAGSSGAVVTGLQLRARSVPAGRTRQAISTDGTSISDFGSKGLPSGLEPVWAGYWDAQAVADLLVGQRGQPLPILRVRFSCPASATTRLIQALSRDLSDRVTVIEPETSTNGPFFVESIAHELPWFGDHAITFGLEAVPSSPTVGTFIIGTSSLGGTDVLAL
jgi:hypothetical protein